MAKKPEVSAVEEPADIGHIINLLTAGEKLAAMPQSAAVKALHDSVVAEIHRQGELVIAARVAAQTAAAEEAAKAEAERQAQLQKAAQEQAEADAKAAKAKEKEPA